MRRPRVQLRAPVLRARRSFRQAPLPPPRLRDLADITRDSLFNSTSSLLSTAPPTNAIQETNRPMDRGRPEAQRHTDPNRKDRGSPTLTAGKFTALSSIIAPCQGQAGEARLAAPTLSPRRATRARLTLDLTAPLAKPKRRWLLCCFGVVFLRRVLLSSVGRGCGVLVVRGSRGGRCRLVSSVSGVLVAWCFLVASGRQCCGSCGRRRRRRVVCGSAVGCVSGWRLRGRRRGTAARLRRSVLGGRVGTLQHRR